MVLLNTFILAEILVLAGGDILPAPAVPSSTRISVRMKCVGNTVHPCMCTCAPLLPGAHVLACCRRGCCAGGQLTQEDLARLYTPAPFLLHDRMVRVLALHILVKQYIIRTRCI